MIALIRRGRRTAGRWFDPPHADEHRWPLGAGPRRARKSSARAAPPGWASVIRRSCDDADVTIPLGLAEGTVEPLPQRPLAARVMLPSGLPGAPAPSGSFPVLRGIGDLTATLRITMHPAPAWTLPAHVARHIRAEAISGSDDPATTPPACGTDWNPRPAGMGLSMTTDAPRAALPLLVLWSMHIRPVQPDRPRFAPHVHGPTWRRPRQRITWTPTRDGSPVGGAGRASIGPSGCGKTFLSLDLALDRGRDGAPVV